MWIGSTQYIYEQIRRQSIDKLEFEISRYLEEKNIKERLKTIQRDQKLMTDIFIERTQLSIQEAEKMFLEAETRTPEQAQEKEKKNVGQHTYYHQLGK